MERRPLAAPGHGQEGQGGDKTTRRRTLLFAWQNFSSEKKSGPKKGLPVPVWARPARGCSPRQPGRYDIVQEWRGLIKPIYMKKLRVGILFGGRSGEHEVSLLSAASVFSAIDKGKFEVVPIGITKEGRWLTAADAENLLRGKLVLESRHLRAGDPETTQPAAVLARGEAVVVPPEPVHRQSGLVPFQTDAALTRRA